MVMEAVEKRPHTEDNATPVIKQEDKKEEEVKEPTPKKTKPVKPEKRKYISYLKHFLIYFKD